MKYDLVMRSWARCNESIAMKHEAVFTGLARVPPPWGIGEQTPPEAPDPGSSLGCGVTISRMLGKGIHGRVYYDFRRRFDGWEVTPDVHDDFLDMSFNPERVDYRQLVVDSAPQLALLLNAYIVEIGDAEFVHMDFNAIRQEPWEGDRRLFVYRVFPVSFFDGMMCHRAFGMRPEEVLQRVKGTAEDVRLVGDGVYILGSSDPLPLAEADRLTWELTECITGRTRPDTSH